MKKISIIVPIYNTEAYLRECLDSLISQTLKEIEIICVDDASTDNSKQIVKEYSSIHNNVKLLEHKKNAGLSETRNSGIKAATGKYIMFVDSDDYILNDACRELYLMAENKKADIVYYSYKMLYSDGSFSHVDSFSSEHVISGREHFCKATREHRNRVPSWTQFYNTEFLQRNNIYFYPGILHEDMLFYFFTAMKAERVVDVENEYYVYRQRDDSIVHQKITEKRVKSWFMIICKIFEFWIENTFSEEENNAISCYLTPTIKRFRLYMNKVSFDNKDYRNSFPEEFLYRVIRNENKKELVTLTQEHIDRIIKADTVVLYGAGMAAEDIYSFLLGMNIKVDQVIVSNVSSSQPFFHEIKIQGLEQISDEEKYKNAVFIIATTEKYHREIETRIQRKGFYNVVRPKDCI